jgi:hypothetical protein
MTSVKNIVRRLRSSRRISSRRKVGEKPPSGGTRRVSTAVVIGRPRRSGRSGEEGVIEPARGDLQVAGRADETVRTTVRGLGADQRALLWACRS